MILMLCLFAAPAPADAVLLNADVLTLDVKSTRAQAIAVRDGRIVAVGTDAAVKKLIGPKTVQWDAKGRMVLPGLYDSHVHPVGVVSTELADPPPVIRSLKDAFRHIREQAKERPKGTWIHLRFVFPTRLDEARFPTKAELDEVAPDHPVLFNAGPASMVNSKALEVSKITRDTPSPPNGMLVKDPKTGEPTGLLRSATGLLKDVPGGGGRVTPEKLRAGVIRQFALYNAEGLTSVSDRNGSRSNLSLYRDLAKKGELTVRVNCSRGFNAGGTPEQMEKSLKEMETDGGPTGGGDDWVRIGPLKTFLDGGMLNGTAYMRQPWPPGPTYQVTEKDYRGLLFIKPDQLKVAVEVAARRKWQFTAHTAGEGAFDVLLDAYEHVNRFVPIKPLRMCVTHANFPSKRNLQRCKELGVVGDVQPAWLYKDGPTLAKVLGAERVRWFQPYRSWLEHTVIGGGSDHMLRFDSLDSTNPWSPWLGIWCAVTRQTERAGVLVKEECLTREQALRLYTIHTAYICHEEKAKGSLEVGKLADFIVVDRDVLKCPANDLKTTKVLLTVVGGREVHRRTEK